MDFEGMKTSNSTSDLEWVVLVTPDIRGVLRGKALSAAQYAAAVQDGSTGITDLIFATDATDATIPTSVGVGPSSGSGDLLLRPDPETLVVLPWQRHWAWCLASATWPDGSPCGVSPRAVCASTLAQLERLGYRVRAAFEYEFRLYDLETGAPVTPGLGYSLQHLGDLSAFVDAIDSAARACGIEVSAFHTEAAPGLVEATLAPALGLKVADQAALLRACIWEVARQHGMRASFLAKPHADEEGSGGHLHLSLVDESETNVFAADLLSGEPVGPILSWAIAGLLDHMAGMSVVYNPNINSYKRLVPGWFAPVAADWAVDDRSAAVRVVGGPDPRATHVELRRAGADANPYLVLAAAAASIAEGLESRESARAPVAPGHAGADRPEAALPSDLGSALHAFHADARLRSRLGDDFSAHFAATREWELRSWQSVVSEWELPRSEGVPPRARRVPNQGGVLS
jgi:glutamine synthetase